MKTIEVDEELYRYIARQTQHIGESASDILRRLLGLIPSNTVEVPGSDQSMAESVLPSVTEPSVVNQLLDSDELANKDSAIDRFMLILSTLYHAQPDAFIRATEIKGRKRVYFAKNEATLLSTGNTTKPRPVPGTPYWVITNTNTGRKRNIVTQLMQSMGYDDELSRLVGEKI